MEKMSTKFCCALTVATAASAVLTATANAEVIIENTAGGLFDTTSGTGTVSYSLAGAGNALVFGSYIDNAVNGENVATNAQFAGAAADGTVQLGRTNAFLFFDPAASGSVTFTPQAGSTNSAYFILELSGVDTAAGFGTGRFDSITTTVADRYVINFQGINNGTGAGVTPDADNITTLVGAGNANGEIGGGAIAVGTGLAGAAGLKPLGWTFDTTVPNVGFGVGEVSFAVSAAVPEPTSLAMLGLGGLAMLRRRRHA